MQADEFIEFIKDYEYSRFLRVEKNDDLDTINVIFKDWINPEVLIKAFEVRNYKFNAVFTGNNGELRIRFTQW